MGAWGHGSFENDAALDWLASEPSADDVRRSIELAEPEAASLSTKACERCIAACELVAAARGASMSAAPPALVAWAERHRATFSGDDERAARLAAMAIARASKLQELFDEEEPHVGWHEAMRDLVDRLVDGRVEPTITT